MGQQEKETTQQRPSTKASLFPWNEIWPLVNSVVWYILSLPNILLLSGTEHCDLLHRVKITAVAQVQVEFCWPFYISPMTCCLHQHSMGPFSSPASPILLNKSKQLNFPCSFKLIQTCHCFHSRSTPLLPFTPTLLLSCSSHSWDHYFPFNVRTLDSNSNRVSLTIPVYPSNLGLCLRQAFTSWEVTSTVLTSPWS